jgi:PAS domain S-box-containing protein
MTDYSLLEAIGDPIFLIDGDWRYLFHNQHAAAYLPYPLSELAGRSLWEAFPSLLGTPLEHAYRRAMSERVRVELESPHPGGSRWYRVSAAPYADGLCIQYQNITERRLAEAELRASEARQRQLTEREAESRAMLAEAEELAHVGSWAVDVATGVLTWSDEMYRIAGIPPGGPAMTFAQLLEYVHPDDREKLTRIYDDLVTGGTPVATEYRQRRPDGSVATIQARGRAQRNAAGETVRLLGSAQDVTERVEGEAALRRAHQLLATVIEDAPLAVVTIDAGLRVTSWNPAAEHIFGWPAADVLGQPMPIVPPERQAELVSMVDEEIVTASFGAVSYETERRRRDGTLIDVHVATAPLHGPHGEITGAVAFMADLSERNQARRALREQEEQHRMVTDSLPVLIGYLDRDERYRFVNRAFEKTFGTTRAAILGRRVEDVVGAEAYGRLIEHLRAALGGQSVTFENEVMACGATRHVSVTYLPHRDESGAVAGVYALLTDATERRQLEEQLRQSQKMEAVGRLAGGVAHDFNNLLTIVTVHCEMLLAQLPDASPVRADIEEIQQAGRRAAALTRQLLAFSRRQVFTLEIFCLNEILSEVQRMFRRLIGEDIRFEMELADDTAPIRGDRAQLTQVLLNLVVNARDAMPHGGTLRIATGMSHVTAAEGRRRGVAPGLYAELRVADTGTGMDEATMARIFEPFFTTKEPGKGTGLGLSTVYGIVKQLEGFIIVDSAPGRGTTFTIRLPGAIESGAPRPPAPATIAPRGSEVVLLVEDDESVREVARRALAHQGYRVIEARNGDEAQRIAEEHAGRIDLLLTDVVMPTMSGPALAEALRRRQPALAILFMSGYNDAAIESQGTLAPDSALIEKPFTVDALAHKVREVLQRSPPQRLAG